MGRGLALVLRASSITITQLLYCAVWSREVRQRNERQLRGKNVKGRTREPARTEDQVGGENREAESRDGMGDAATCPEDRFGTQHLFATLQPAATTDTQYHSVRGPE